MTTYASEEDYIRDQINSFILAKKEIQKLKHTVLEKHLEDLRGDKEKLTQALDAGIRFLNQEQKRLHQLNEDQ